MEQQNKKKTPKIIGASALLLLSLGACSFYALTQQNNQQTQVAVEETTKQVVEVEVESKSTKETTHTDLKEEVIDKVVELSKQSVSEESVSSIIAFAETRLIQPEELDKVVTLIEKPTTELDKVVGLAEKDNKKQDTVAVLPTPSKPIEEENPTVSSDDNNKPTTPIVEQTNPVAPVEPTTPTVEQTNPVVPVEPTTPSVQPGTPSGDTTPSVQPGTPSGDTTPSVQPGTPSGDTTPSVQPGTPSGDTTPSVQPGTPSGDTTPSVQPGTPSDDTTPSVQPGTPSGDTTPSVQPGTSSEELSEDEKQLDIKTKVVDGKEVKYATGEATTTEASPELDISKLTAEPTTNHLNQ